MLQKLARWCVERRRIVVFGIWLPLLLLVGFIAGGVGASWSTSFTLPDSESADVQKLVEKVNPEMAGLTGQIVFETDPDVIEQGVRDPEVQQQMTEFFDQVDELDDIAVDNPYEDQFAGQISDRGENADMIAFAQLNITDMDFEAAVDLGDEIRAIGNDVLGEGVDRDGLTVEYGGDIFMEFELPESEALGLMAAVVILILAFGSVLAMGLPIGTALFGLGIASSLVMLASNVLDMPDFTQQMVAMIGIGVGIDYALFIVTRYREGLSHGLPVVDAIVDAIDTAGRAVVFAGLTVIISLLGLLLLGLGFVQGLSVGAAAAVGLMILGSITLLPALLGMVGTRIGTTSRAALASVAFFVVCGLVWYISSAGALLLVGFAGAILIYAVSFAVPALRVPLPHRKEKAPTETVWYRWSHFIQRRPWPVLVGSTLVLVLLAIPLFSIRLGFGDAGNLNEEQTARRAYDTLAVGFGPGASGPLIVTIEGEDASNADLRARFTETLDTTTGVARAQTAPEPLTPDLALVTVYPEDAPQDEATTQLVDRLRDDVIPEVGVESRVGGFTASSVDFANYLGSRLPLLIGVVLILSFILLMAVFRSILVPLKAVLLNLLSIGGAYGIIVAIFQWGWGKELIGVDRAGPIDAWIPMMLFAIVFGLSMDYEVFLLSRIKEKYDQTGDNSNAVADGLTVTARVITAAALIMVCVFGAFVLGEDRSLKLFGLGMALAVAIDATIVRMLLVPATMELLGNRNWWIPRWLDRILPNIEIEGHVHEAPERDDSDDGSEPPSDPRQLESV